MADQDYATMLEAALAGTAACYETMPRDLECGFGVYRGADGKYYATPVQSGTDKGIEGMKLRIPSTSQLVALGHTHPAHPNDDSSHAFSKEDLQFAKRTGLDMYLGSEKSGKVVHYKEGKTKAERHSTLGRISYGVPVGDYGTPPTRREELAAAYDLHSQPTKP